MARYVHKLIKSTAIAMTREVYDECCSRSDRFYERNRNMDVWVAKNWKDFVRGARELLVGMLGNPSVEQEMKDEIYKAILDDRSIPKGQGTPVQGNA